jgi:hypothetical protein
MQIADSYMTAADWASPAADFYIEIADSPAFAAAGTSRGGAKSLTHPQNSMKRFDPCSHEGSREGLCSVHREVEVDGAAERSSNDEAQREGPRDGENAETVI